MGKSREKYTELGKRLVWWIEKNHVSVEAFAALFGSTRSTLDQFIRGDRNIGGIWRKRLELYGMDWRWLETGEGTGSPLIKEAGVGYDVKTFGETHYPVVSHIRCGPGTVGNTTVYDIIAQEDGPGGKIYQGCIYFEVRGNSMEPRWGDGDRVLINPKIKPSNGGYGVVCWDDEEGSLKRIFYKLDSIILQSLNPDFEPITVKKDAIWFIGKAVHTKHKD